MAHPGDPFSNAQLTPEEADRLALMFRPSWELDEAPFTGPGSLSPSEVAVLQGGGVRQDVRAATLGHGSNGAHPEPSVVVAQDADQTIVERAATAQDAPPSVPVIAPPVGTPPPAIGSKTIMGIQAPILAPTGPSAPAGPPPAPPATAQPTAQTKGPPSRPSQRPSAPTFDLAAKPRAAPARPAAAAVETPSFRKKPSMGLWVGVGAGAVMLLALGIYAMTSGGGEKSETPAASADKPPVDDKLANVPPPPPPVTTTVAVATTAVAPPTPPAVTAPVPTQAAAVASPAPTPTHVAAAAPPTPRPTFASPAPAAPHPTGKKGGQTIVRDVPF
jgi:hypothetical protein